MKYNLQQFSTKYNEVTKLFENVSDRILLCGEIRKSLLDCIKEDDLVKALAVIEYAEKKARYTSDELYLINDTEDISSILTAAYTYDEDRTEFASELSGLCKAFGYIEE